MALRRASLLLLGVALGPSCLGLFVALPPTPCAIPTCISQTPVRGCPSSSRHSLCYSCLKVPEPSQGLPQFLSMIRLDDQPIARSDSLNSTMVLLVPWMEAEQAEIFMDLVRRFWTDLEQLSNLNPETGAPRRQEQRGFLHYGYDGMDFISFDKETLRWRADHPQAQKVKETWEEDPRWSQGNKDLLEKTCIDMIQECLSHQKKSLKKAEPPVGKVTLKVVFGFYPKEIQATWTRDGEPCVYETLRRNVAPNSDGTYYISLSIEIDPKERDHFQCYLDHDGLWRPLVLAFKEETAIIWKILVGIGAATVLGAGIIFLSSQGIQWTEEGME
ncbi:hypothetical protein E2320_014292 [Naja naja]|nr:hypothetical protein E2320_014292 [Naja naja]